MLIHEEYGSRLHLAVVTTDLPLTVDEPVDMGVEDVCKVCMKCAQTCPTYSIPFGDKVVINGVEKWAINVDTCYKGRLAGRGEWTSLSYLHYLLLLQQALGMVAYPGRLDVEEDSHTPATALYQAVALDGRSHLGQEALAPYEVDGLRQCPGAR